MLAMFAVNDFANMGTVGTVTGVIAVICKNRVNLSTKIMFSALMTAIASSFLTACVVGRYMVAYLT